MASNVQSIRPEAPKPVAPTVNPVVAQLSAHAVTLAGKAWNDYNGILGLQAKIAGKLGNISQHVLTIAKEAVASTYEGEQAKMDAETRVKLSVSRFNAALAAGLAHVTEKHKDVDADVMKGFARTWGQYASNIRAGVTKGIDIRDFDSETGIRAAVQAMKPKNAGASGQTPTSGMTEEQKETIKETQQAAVAVAKESDKIAQGVQAVLMALKEADIDKHEDDILECLELCRQNLTRFKLVKVTTANVGKGGDTGRVMQA